MTDGLTKLGPGRWRARITWRDARGKKHDTDRVIEAPSKAQALVERERLREELAGTGDEWTIGAATDAYLAGANLTALAVLPEPNVDLSALSALVETWRKRIASCPNRRNPWMSGACDVYDVVAGELSDCLAKLTAEPSPDALDAMQELRAECDRLRGELQDAWKALEQLRRDNALLWKMVERVSEDGYDALAVLARELLDARKAGG